MGFNLPHDVNVFRVDVIDLDLNTNVVVMNEDDAKILGVNPGSKVRLAKGERESSAQVILTKTMIQRGSILVGRDLFYSLKLSVGDTVYIKPISVTQGFIALQKRLRGEKLSYEDVLAIVRDVTTGSFGEAEIASFLVSQVFHRLSDDELHYLVKAMVETGTKVVFEEPVYDIHSIGGVPGNGKVALISVPTVASAGLLIPKTSSRAITSAAGTADIVEVLARVDFTAEELKEIALKTRGALAWGGSLNLAPADDIFVNVERKLNIDPWHQMVASILAKKIAMDVSNLVIDIPVGRKVKVESVEQAEVLSGLFISQAARFNLRVKVAITYGGQPIGETVGPALEAREALEALINKSGRRSLIDKALSLAGLAIELSGRVQLGMGYEVAKDIFLSGKAYEKFKQIVEEQGGNPNVKPEEIPIGGNSATIYAPIEGAITHIDNAALIMAARAAGAPFDKGAGIRLHAKIGHRVNKNDPLLTIYSSSSSRLEEALNILSKTPSIIVEGMVIKVLP